MNIDVYIYTCLYTVDSPVSSFLMYCGCFQHKYPVREIPEIFSYKFQIFGVVFFAGTMS
jgi:hypothetical protein